MRKAIAKIRLAPGNVAWYDPLSNVYLTLTSPEAFIYDDDNISNVKNGIRHNCIILKEGILPSLSNDLQNDIIPLDEELRSEIKEVVEEVKIEIKNIKDEDIIPLVEKEEPKNEVENIKDKNVIPLVEKEEVKIEEIKNEKILKGKKKAKNSINQKNSETITNYNKKDKANELIVLENLSDKDKKE